MSPHRIILCLLVALSLARHVAAKDSPPLPRYTLAQCVDLALKQNADVRVAQKRVEEASGTVLETRAGMIPSLTANSTYQWLDLNYAAGNLTGTNHVAGSNRDFRESVWNVNVRVTETLFAAGAVRGRYAIATLQKESRMSDYRAVVDRVLMETRIAFYEILRNQADVAVHEQAVAFFSEQAKNEKNRLEVGTGQKLNVLRAEVNLSLEQSAWIDSRNRLRNSFLRLSELLAIPYSVEQDQTPFDVDGVLRHEKLDLSVDDCLSRARTHRPELTSRENEIRIQKKQLVVDRSEYFPRIEAFGGYDVVSEPDRRLGADSYHGFSVGVMGSWHIFDGFATAGRMRATRSRLRAAETSFEEMQRTIEADVLRAYRDLQRAEENIRTQSANVELATESVRLAKGNFEVGLTSQLELLQSQLDLTRAQTAELSARFDYNAALSRLQRAMSSEFHITDGRANDGGTP